MFDNKYPYTDYHELNLDWFMGEFKKLVAEWVETKGEWNTLHDYVQNYFNNLNVQTEIDNKINAMIADGTFADIVSPFVTATLPALVAGQLPDVVAAQISSVVAAQISAVVAAQLPAVAAAAAAEEVRAWLVAHIDPDTGYVIDDTLTVQNAAADSKTVGDKIDELNDLFEDVVPHNYFSFTNDNFRAYSAGGAVSNLSETGFTFSHPTDTSYQAGFVIPGLTIGKEYKIRLTINERLTHLFVASQDYYSQDYAISTIYAPAEAGSYELTFTPVRNDTTLMFRSSYAIPSVTVSDAICYLATDDIGIKIKQTTERKATKSVLGSAIIGNGLSISPTGVLSLNSADTIDPTTYYGNDFLTFTKCLCVGDSLTEGVFNHNEGGSLEFATIPKYSYPSQMTKIYGIETTNKGTGGATSAQWYTAHANDDLSGHDVCIIALGANDALQSVSKADTKSALLSIITMIKAQNNKIKIFLCTLLPAYYANDTAHNATNDAIKETVNENSDCYLIDLTQYSVCKSNTKYAQGHLTALGYMTEAEEIVSIASYIIHTSSKDEFRYIQFINTNYSHS